MRQKQFVSSDKARDVDIVALAAEVGICSASIWSRVVAASIAATRASFPEHAEGYDETQALEAFLEQHYLNREVPPLILVNRQIDARAARRIAERSRPVIRCRSPPATAGERREWLEMAETNAHVAIQQRVQLHATQEARLQALQQALGLPGSSQRIECFDISHTMRRGDGRLPASYTTTAA